MQMSDAIPNLMAAERGATITEFALILPVFALVLFGFLDVGHTLYVQSVLQGIVQKAARDATLETGSTQAKQDFLDNLVRTQVRMLNSGADVQFNRRFFKDFTKAAQAVAEPFTDINNDGFCNAGEPFQDNNANNFRDLDGGDAGQGSAKDNVVYTVTVTYPRMFPANIFMGMTRITTLRAKTVLANQPFGEQSQYATPVVGHC
jgi:Flp pilus assembly protein TadG